MLQLRENRKYTHMSARSREMGMDSVLCAMQEYIFTLVAVAVGFLAVVYMYEPYWKLRHIPGTTPLPLISHLHLLAKHGPDVFSVLEKKHGPIFRQDSAILL